MHRRLIYLTCLASVFAVIGSPAMFVMLNNHRDLSHSDMTIVFAGTALGVMILIAAYMRFPRLTLLAIAILATIAGIEDWFIWHYGWPIDANTLNVIIETNPAESFDFISSIPLYGPVTVLLIPITLCIILWNNHHTLPRTHSIRLIGLATFGLIGIGCSALLDAQGASPTPDETFHPDPTGQFLALRATYPAGAILTLFDLIEARIDLQREIQKKKSFTFGIEKLHARASRRVYVLVIGESARSDHLGINGYARQTTPLLSNRTDIIPLRRMYTVPTFTRLAVPVILSRKPPESTAATFPEGSIVTAYKEAGFGTTWISLQAPVGYHESPVSVHAAEADKEIFLNPLDYRNQAFRDNQSIIELRKILNDEGKRDQFIVIHLLGSHFQYTDRYPSEFANFLPDRKRNGRKTQLFDINDKNYLINAYDNSILFTDSVLNGIIDELGQFKQNESWMMYSSDHGEALFDDCRKLSGHGLSSLATQSVASLFWASSKYREAYPDKVANVRGHANSLKSTAMMFETLADLGGLKITQSREGNSIASNPLRNPNEVASFEKAEQEACATPAHSPITDRSSRSE